MASFMPPARLRTLFPPELVLPSPYVGGSGGGEFVTASPSRRPDIGSSSSSGCGSDSGSGSGAVVVKVEAWVRSGSLSDCVQGLRLGYSDGGVSCTLGTCEGDRAAYSCLRIPCGALVTGAWLWKSNHDSRLGGIRLTLSTGEDWTTKGSPSAPGSRTFQLDVGSGLLLGVFGRMCNDIDGLGLVFLRPVVAVSACAAYSRDDVQCSVHRHTLYESSGGGTGWTSDAAAAAATAGVEGVKLDCNYSETEQVTCVRRTALYHGWHAHLGFDYLFSLSPDSSDSRSSTPHELLALPAPLPQPEQQQQPQQQQQKQQIQPQQQPQQKTFDDHWLQGVSEVLLIRPPPSTAAASTAAPPGQTGGGTPTYVEETTEVCKDVFTKPSASVRFRMWQPVEVEAVRYKGSMVYVVEAGSAGLREFHVPLQGVMQVLRSREAVVDMLD